MLVVDDEPEIAEFVATELRFGGFEVIVAHDGPRGLAAARSERPDLVLLNDGDLTYAKIRLDDHSLETVTQHISGFEASLPRALCWAAAWDMVRDSELRARDYVRLFIAGVNKESDIGVVQSLIRQVQGAVTSILGAYRTFRDLDATMLEMLPIASTAPVVSVWIA